MRKLALHLPINSVSFGQVSTLLLRTIWEKEQKGESDINWNLFPIDVIDLGSQTALPQEFVQWLQQKIANSMETFSRDTPMFKLWHLNGSLESFSRNQTLLSFYELDNPTKIELNIARNNNKLCLSSQYAVNVFKIYGVEANFLPLAFDSFNFRTINKQFHTDGRIVFNLCGKLEKRKHHAKVIQAWIKKYGNNSKYVLQCAVYNPFLGEKGNNELLGQILGGNKPFNVTFYPHMKENQIYNEFLNSANIIIGMSGGEGWGLPEFHSVAIGKHAILLNAHAYKTWATKDMVTMVQPSGKISAVDGMFFRPGDVWNQGNIFDWNEEEFLQACEEAVIKYQKNPINKEGLTLQEKFSKDKFLDSVISLTEAQS